MPLPVQNATSLKTAAPGMCQRLNAVESELREVKTILLQLAEKIKYFYGI